MKQIIPMLLVSTLLIFQEAEAQNLLDLYDQASEYDPTLKVAKLQTEMTEAQRAQAGGALLPQINANVNLSMNQQLPNGLVREDSYRGERYNVSLTQTIFDAPKLLNWERFYSIVEQYEANQEDAQQAMMYNLVDRYFKVLEQLDNLNLVEQELTSTSKQLQQLQRQFEKQLVQITDVYELEAKQDTLVADKIAIETALAVARQNLKELTGQQHDDLALLRDDIEFPILPGDIEALVEKAKALNPALIAQEKSIAAAEINVDQIKAKHLPTLDAQLTYFNTNTGYQNTQTPVVETEVAALNINVPLFSGGTTTHATEEAYKNLALNREKRQAMLGTLIKDIHDSFLSTNANVQRIQAAQKALQSSTKAREAMEKGFQYNMQTIGDVLVSQARESKAKRDLLQAKYEYIKNRSRFERVTGQINKEYLFGVNQWLHD